MLDDLRRQQLRYVLFYSVAGTAAGVCLGFAWAGHFLTWWQAATTYPSEAVPAMA